MAITGLDLPIDIPWERVCVTTDMLDPASGAAANMPPLFQTSITLYRYVPPDDYQVYPNRRIIYYKLTCTITNYQPKSEQIVGMIDPGLFSTGYMLDAEVQRRITASLPCSAAVVQVTVSPSETGRSIDDYPYFLDAQPRQRLLYEQVTEGQERASRSLEGLQIRKSAGTSNSMEVLDVDKGGGVNVSAGGVGVGGQRQGEWGAKSLGKQDADLVTTTDGSREQRETLSHTTQLSQMYTLLQVYHLGTNRVFFYITPRPHSVEPPTGIAGPRKLDGIQDLFLIVSQPKGDQLPCITARLDTGHLSILPVFDYDRSVASKVLTVDLTAPAPLDNDPQADATNDGTDAFYDCFFKSVTASDALPAPTDYIIENTVDIENTAMGRPGLPNTSQVLLTPDKRLVTITATATGFACHRSAFGDIVNAGTVGPLRHVGVEPVPDNKDVQPGHVRRSITVSFRSEVPSKKIGEQYALALTMRQLKCCGETTVVPPKLVAVVPFEFVPFEFVDTYVPTEPVQQTNPNIPTTPGSSTGTTASTTPTPTVTVTPGATPGTPTTPRTITAMNDFQRRLGEETLRLSSAIPDAGAAPSHDAQFLLESLAAGVVSDPRRRTALAASAESVGLTRDETARLAEAMGRSNERLSCADLLAIPDQVLEAVTKRSGAELTRLRLSAAGIPTRGTDGHTAPAKGPHGPAPDRKTGRQ